MANIECEDYYCFCYACKHRFDNTCYDTNVCDRCRNYRARKEFKGYITYCTEYERKAN